jgi:hypothetical protein
MNMGLLFISAFAPIINSDLMYSHVKKMKYKNRNNNLNYSIMKKLLILVLFASVVSNVWSQRKPAIPKDAEIEAKVEKELSKMTLDDKIGQMLELNFDVMGTVQGDTWKLKRNVFWILVFQNIKSALF